MFENKAYVTTVKNKKKCKKREAETLNDRVLFELVFLKTRVIPAKTSKHPYTSRQGISGHKEMTVSDILCKEHLTMFCR